MEKLKDNKQLKRNLLYLGLSLLIVTVYILIDGLGMIMTSIKSFGDSKTVNVYLSNSVGDGIIGFVWEQYVARIILLVIIALPLYSWHLDSISLLNLRVRQIL